MYNILVVSNYLAIFSPNGEELTGTLVVICPPAFSLDMLVIGRYEADLSDCLTSSFFNC